MGKKIKILWLIFAFFFHFSISHSSVIHREICVEDFSGTTVCRILELDTNVGYDLLYCSKENRHAAAYYSPCLSIFLSLQANFLLQISQLLWEPESSNSLYTLRVAKYIVGQNIYRKQNSDLFCLISHFSISHSNVNTSVGKFVTNISQELLHVGFCNLVQVLWIICCCMWKRTRLLLLILPLISSFSFKFQNIKFLVTLFCEAYNVETWIHTWAKGWSIVFTKYKQPEYTCSFIFLLFSVLPVGKD